MSDNTDSDPLEFPGSDPTEPSLPALPSDDSLDELLLKPHTMENIMNARVTELSMEFIPYNPETESENETSARPRSISVPESSSESSHTRTLTDREKKDRRNAREREKRKREREKKKEAEGDGDEDEEATPKKKRRVVRRKKRSAKPDVSESDQEVDDDPPKKLTVYVEIRQPTPTQRTTSKSKQPMPPSISKGPFKHAIDKSFRDFKRGIAEVTPCNVKMLATSSLTWKFDKPQSATARLMTNEVGYKAMIDAAKEKRGDSVIWVYMAPPAKDAAWDTGDPDQVADPFDYDEEIAAQNPEGPSRQAQMTALATQTTSHAEALYARYPMDTVPEFPNKRIYKNADGRCWELTDLRLKVRAAHIAKGTATLETPPQSIHFNDDKKLRAPAVTGPVPDAPVPVAGPVHGLPAWQQPHGWPAYFPPAYGAPYGYPPAHLPPQHPQPPSGYGPPAYVGPQQNPPTAFPSPGTARARKVPLADFCNRYDISDADKAKLVALEYKPGNKAVEGLDEKEWKGEAKFSRLAWDEFISAHRRFCCDVKDGLWD